MIGAQSSTSGQKEPEKRFSKQLIGKTVVSKTGKKFGELDDLIFETKTGELINLVLVNPTPYADKLELEKSKDGDILIPFSAVTAIGDFVVIAEEDIV
jgi:sporulation protein YlmC with PRC-barrel domain